MILIFPISILFYSFTLGDWKQAKEMERRAADDESDDLKTMQEPRKKRLMRQPAKYSPNSYVMGNRKKVYSSSSNDASRAVVPSSQVSSKQKRSSGDLEDELQQQEKPQSESIVDSSPFSYGYEG
jgi:hypothetical protein